MQETTIVFIIFGIISLVLVRNFANKWLEIQQKNSNYQYKLQKMKFKRQLEDEEEDEDEDENELKESIPKWLLAAAQGAGINIDNLISGDIGEVQKVIPLLQKLVSVAGQGKSISGNEIKY